MKVLLFSALHPFEKMQDLASCIYHVTIGSSAVVHVGEMGLEEDLSTGSSNIIYYLIAFLCGIMVMYLIGRFTRPKKTKHVRLEGIAVKGPQAHSPEKKEIARLTSEVRRLNFQLADYESLRTELSRVRLDGVPQVEVRTAEWDISKDTLKVGSVPPLFETVLYFPNPNIDGDFRQVDSKDNYTEGASIYKFSLSSPTEATYEFCQDRSAIGMAFNNRNELIKSVATESNSYTPEASSILCISKGKAVLEGTTWRVIEKAQIKYI